MKSFKVIMVAQDGTELTCVAHGLSRQIAMLECARMNREREGISKYKIHYIIR